MTPKTHQELVERCAEKLIDLDPTMNGYHSDHIAAKLLAVEAILSEVYAAVEEPSEAMLQAVSIDRLERVRQKVADGSIMYGQDAKQTLVDDWRAMLAASPLAKEGE